ncbi:MAG TPA: putative metal-binding motif-containing protein, partial [Flavobacteriales bacterium]|nr:putative metal-binding motif-containing protein [Flavobacteriales bacterium]
VCVRRFRRRQRGGADATFAFTLGNVIVGCMDPNSCNYDPSAVCPGDCTQAPEWYADQDGDGFGDSLVVEFDCDQPVGFVNNPLDCDDGEALVFPGAPELCDGLDNDCDGTIDEDFFWYTDADEDGFGDDATVQISCTPVSGAVQVGGDCDDTDPDLTAVGQPCDDGDPDTDGDVVREDCTCLGFPSGPCPPGEIPDCNGNCAPADWVGDGICDNGSFEHNGIPVFFNCPEFDNDGGDCDGCTTEVCDGVDNDCDGEIDEGFVEICNGLDDDCDGSIDEGLVWFDLDGDGFGDSNAPAICGDPNSVADSTDCDDTDPLIFTTLTLFVFTEDETLDGSAHFVITQGTAIHEGDITLLASEFGLGQVQVCLGSGCFSVDVTPNDVALWNESYIALSNDPGNFTAFDPALGYEGSTTGTAIETCNGIDDDCDGLVDEGCTVSVSARVFLEGPYNSALGLMHDGMRSLGLVPTVEPYTGLGYSHMGGGGESTSPAVLAEAGGEAIVDWVVVELRSEADPTVIVATRCALLQRDGAVVDVDGQSPVSFTSAPGDYHVAVRHRNHLGVMTASVISLESAVTVIDLTVPATPTYGTAARKSITGDFPAHVLWAGDVTFNGQLQYVGDGNDRDPILQRIGGSVPTTTISGYHPEDVNLDGAVKYVGEGNDRDPILQNIGGSVPTNTRAEQLP